MRLKKVISKLLVLAIIINMSFYGTANAEGIQTENVSNLIKSDFIETTTSSQLDLDLDIKKITNFEELKNNINTENKLIIEDTILIDENFTFQNDVEFIRANNFYGDLFRVLSGSNVVLNDFKINKADSSVNNGSVFCVDQGGSLEVLNGTFIGNKSELSGSVIHNKGNVRIENVIIKNNSSNSSGGAIYNEGDLNIGGGQFEGNISKLNGGAIYNTGIMSIYGGYFENNSSDSLGGAVYSESKFDIRAAGFQNNSQTEIIDGKYNNTVFAKDGFSAYGDYYPVDQSFYSEKDVINNSNMLEINALSYFNKLINNDYLIIEDKLVVNTIDNKANIDLLEISPKGTLEVEKELIGGVLNNGKLNIMYSGKIQNEIHGNGTIVYDNSETLIFDIKTQNNILVKRGFIKAESNENESNDIILDGGVYIVEDSKPQKSKEEQHNLFYIKGNSISGNGFVDITTNQNLETDRFYYFGKYNSVEDTVKLNFVDKNGKIMDIPKGYKIKIEKDDKNNYYGVLREIPKEERIYYTVIFQDDDKELSRLVVEENDGIVPIKAPEKEGYEFMGWYTSIEGGVEVKDFSKIVNSMTLYAKYTKKVITSDGSKYNNSNRDQVTYYTVLFKDKNDRLIENIRVKENSEIIPPKAKYIEGYEFIGWYTELEDGTEVKDFTKIEKSMTVYERYTKKNTSENKVDSKIDNNVKAVIKSQDIIKTDNKEKIYVIKNIPENINDDMVIENKYTIKPNSSNTIKVENVYETTKNEENDKVQTQIKVNNDSKKIEQKSQKQIKKVCKVHIYMSIILILSLILDLYSIFKDRKNFMKK